jgi:hypothetical protein
VVADQMCVSRSQPGSTRVGSQAWRFAGNAKGWPGVPGFGICPFQRSQGPCVAQ